VAGLFLLASASALDPLLAALLRSRWLAWVLTVALLGADVGSVILLGPTDPIFLGINNTVLVLLVASVSVLWAQGGLRARDAAVLCAAVGIYDLVATSVFTVTDELLARLASTPLIPQIAWGTANADWVSIGLGDLVLATLFPLVQRKAFGRAAGIMALGVSLAGLAMLLLLGAVGAVQGSFPVMVVVGPLTVLQYVAWRHKCGPERTTWQYLQDANALS
jgi:hypothetical protein